VFVQGELQYQIVGDGTALAFFELEQVGTGNARTARVSVVPNSRLFFDLDTQYAVSSGISYNIGSHVVPNMSRIISLSASLIA